MLDLQRKCIEFVSEMAEARLRSSTLDGHDRASEPVQTLDLPDPDVLGAGPLCFYTEKDEATGQAKLTWFCDLLCYESALESAGCLLYGAKVSRCISVFERTALQDASFPLQLSGGQRSCGLSDDQARDCGCDAVLKRVTNTGLPPAGTILRYTLSVRLTQAARLVCLARQGLSAGRLQPAVAAEVDGTRSQGCTDEQGLRT